MYLQITLVEKDNALWCVPDPSSAIYNLSRDHDIASRYPGFGEKLRAVVNVIMPAVIRDITHQKQ